MSVRDEIYTRLTTGSTALTALIGTRAYRRKLPQNPTMPAVTYFKVSGNRLQSLEGPVGVSDPRIQVSCFARTAAGSDELADEVRAVLDGWTSTGNVQGCACVNEVDLYDDDVELYHTAVDFVLMHNE